MKRMLMIAVLLTGWATAFAQGDDFDRIIDIKLNTAQNLWGEARLANRDDAVKLATDLLVDEINNWLVTNTCDRSSKEILDLHQIIAVRKGPLHLVLAYVPIGQIYSPVSEGEKEEDGNGGVAALPDSRSDEVVALILVTKKIDALQQLLEEDELVKEYCQWGEIDKDTNPTSLRQSYLVIFDPGTRDVVAVLTPRQPKRVNLFTGEEDSTSRYPGHKAYWITVKD